MKKLIALIITIVMCSSIIVACDNNDNNKTTENGSSVNNSVVSSITSVAPSSVDSAVSAVHSADKSESGTYSSNSSSGINGSGSYDASADSSINPTESAVQSASDSYQSASEGSQSGSSDPGQSSSGGAQGNDSEPAFKVETLEFDSGLTGEQAIKAFAIEKFDALFAATRSVVSDNANKLFGAAYATVELKLYLISGDDEAIKSDLSKIYNSAYKLYAAFYKGVDTVENIKARATTIVDSLYDIAATGVSEDKIASIKQNVDSIKNSIKGSKDVESVGAIETNEISKVLVEKIENYINNAISEKLSEVKSLAKERLDQAVGDALDLLQDDVLAARLNAFYEDESAKLMAIDSLDDIDSTINEVSSDLVAFIDSLKKEKIAAIKLEIKTELDSKINALTAKISDEELRGQINTYYANEIAVITNIATVEDARAAISVIKADTESFVKEVVASQLTKLKTNALSELDTAVSTAIGKLKTQSLKDSLNEFYGQEKKKLEAIDSLDTAPATLAEIKNDVINYAKKLVASQTAELRKACKGYLVALKSALEYSPYDFVPRTMRPDYAANYVNVNDVTYDFTSFVAVSSINYGGFGEQWHMVVDNIDQSALFYKYLNYGDAVVTTAVSALSAYLDDEYSETVEYTIDAEKYYASIGFADGVFSVELVYKAGLNIPVIGDVNPSIEMAYNVSDASKDIGISLGEGKSLRYEIGSGYYRFGLELAMSAYTRTSYISFERKDSTVEGHIYEYHTVKGKDAVKSCADFYITDQYVSVVGNKASGMIGFSGFINELYDVNYGKLIGYEVEETASYAGVSGTYNTLWFNLSDISGVTSVKALDHDQGDKKNPNDIYINGNDSAIFASTYNKKLGVKTSRKYDIELRKRYFYSTDAEGKLVEIEVEIPMMFIQEDNDKDSNFSDYPTDVSAANGITSEVTLNSTYLNKILADYDELIPVFKTNKDTIDSNYIKAYIEG